MPTNYQYQVKLRIAKEEKPPQIENIREYSIKKISYLEAKDFIIKYEWLKNMGTSKICYGIYFSGFLGGVVCFGPLVAPTKYVDLFGKDFSKSIIQLTRGASTFWTPRWCSSKLISKSLKSIYSEYGYKIVVCYCDPDAGEIGIVYQSCNAYYIGLTNPGGGKRYIINGHSYDPRKVVSKFGSRAHKFLLNIDKNYKTIPINRKHRYIFLLGTRHDRKKAIDRVKTLIMPYPKS